MVCKVSQKCIAPTERDWKALKHLFRYLQRTRNYELRYSKLDINVSIFSDADWANDLSDAKSITGYAIMLAGGVVSWRSRETRYCGSQHLYVRGELLEEQTSNVPAPSNKEKHLPLDYL